MDKPIYLLDTNICVFLLRGNLEVIDRFKEAGIDNCCISEITIAELLFGAECSSDIKHNKKLVESFCSELKVLPIYEAIETFAKEKTKLRKEGKLIDDFDLLIGATAKYYDLILISDNTKHFQRLKVNLQNWRSH